MCKGPRVWVLFTETSFRSAQQKLRLKQPSSSQPRVLAWSAVQAVRVCKFQISRVRCFSFSFFKRVYLFTFRERGKKREREGEKHQCEKHRSGASCRRPDQELNLKPRHMRNCDLLLCGTIPNKLSHTGQGKSQLLFLQQQQSLDKARPACHGVRSLS